MHSYDNISRRLKCASTKFAPDDIIVNGDLQEEAASAGEQSCPPPPKTTKQLTAKRNQERVKSILLLAIPDEYLLKFHNVPDAKSLWAAIKSSLDKAYDRFQKLISQFKVHAAPVSKEDINQKFLRSLPPSWSQIALIMINKPDIDQTDIDDLYNNLRVYEDEMKRSSSSTSNSQNLAFLSSENTSSTNEVSATNGNFRVNIVGGTNSSSQVSSTSGADEAVCSFFAQQTTNPPLDNEDLQQIDQDDLEELDNRWQVAMTGHFAKECKSGRNQGKRSYGDNGRRNATTNEPSSQALVAQDGLGGYDWSNDFDEPVNYALMAISSSSSSSSSDNEVQNYSKQCLESFKTLQKNFDSEREKHSRARLEIQGYELALESLESRILGHEKNELAWGEKYEFQNYELKCREIKINNLKMELEKVVKERDELKVKIEKWEESSKGLNKLLNSQMSAKDKNGLGYGTQLDEMSNKSETDSEISMSVFEVRSSDEEITPANDRFSKADGYHAVPPPITGNFLTPRADISFAGLDEYAIRKKIIESKTTELNTDTSKSKTSETVGKTNEVNIEKPKSAHELIVPKPKIYRDKVIIKDWYSDDKDDVSEVNTVTPARRTFVPLGVLTRTGLVNPVRTNGKRAVHTVSTARPISTTRLVSTARPFAPKIAQNGSAIRPIYPRMDNVRPRASYSSIKRVKNMTTAGTRAVVNTGKGKMNNDLKKSRWVWRPKGNYMDHESKEKGSFILKKFEYVDPKGISKSMMDVKRYVMLFGLRIKGLVCAAQKYFTMEMMFGLGNKMLLGLVLEAINGKRPNWLFDLDYLTDSMNYQPVRSENQANKTAGSKKAKHSAGTQDNIDAGNSKKEAESAQDYFVLPIWSSYTSIVKSSDVKNEGASLELTKYIIVNTLESHHQGIFSNASYNDEGAVADFTNLDTTVNVSPIPTSRIHTIHPKTKILGDPTSAVQTRSKVNKSSRAHAFVSYIQKQRRNNHKDFHQMFIASSYTSKLNPRNILKSLEDESWVDAMQEELLQFKIQKIWILVDLPNGKRELELSGSTGIAKDKEVLIEAIKIFFAFASYMGFIVYQMDVKSAFLYGIIDEEVYVSQPLEILKKFDFSSVKTASTPIETQKPLVKDEEATDVDVHLYRSMIGSLMYLTTSRPDIMFVVCACSRFQVTPKTFHLHDVKRIFRKMPQPEVSISWQVRLISWQCKKQTIMATFTTEAEYVSAANCFGQVLWIENQIIQCFIPKQSILQSGTTSLGLSYEKETYSGLKIHTDDNVADLFTKAFNVSRFNFLIVNIECSTNYYISSEEAR
ncbi:ribonuclease H-like domain-containing protein [Tanacetum coccineum]